jgi:hypothetical protein
MSSQNNARILANLLFIDCQEEGMYASKNSLSVREKPTLVRPMSRKDIFYSGSVTNLKEYQSQKSLSDYRNSVISLTKYEKERSGDLRFAPVDVEKAGRSERK